MSKTPVSHRIFTFTMAMLFFVTALSFSFLVIWELHTSSSSNTTNNTTSTSNTTNSNSKLPVLVGTKLQNFTPVTTVNSLQIQDETAGHGAAVTSAKQTVTFEYTGALAKTGIIFQSSLQTGQSASDPLNDLIQGFQKGMIGMKVGGTRRILIPSNEAYGSNPPSGIPANAPLVFDVTLLKVQ
ncbi:MAG: FKBP-type peptidyl-prolyl cis-trans isomerase [Candidatus Saccharimonadales bacterium]|jgi:FKBP-type peptidyl-prolyl cis-trans isomerase